MIVRTPVKAPAPLAATKAVSDFSIKKVLEAQEILEANPGEVQQKKPANHHFTETDLRTEWAAFLENLRRTNVVKYSAVGGFILTKKDEDTVLVACPSDSAKKEFMPISDDFFNHFRHKVDNFAFRVVYEINPSLKVEILTKRKIFDKFAEINPVLRELDDIMKFDFN